VPASAVFAHAYIDEQQMRAYRTGRFLVKQFIKRNTDYLKRTSSGRDVVIYCGPTPFVWHPHAEGLFAGSEEAVINLTRALSALGWDITVYNSCGHKPVVDQGVTYRPFWDFNPRDKQDVMILWKPAKPLDWQINADKIFVDMHDPIPEKMFTDQNRIAQITGVFVKSQFQRSLYPNLPDHKLAVIPNGIDLGLLDGNERKDPYLLINTSSADRSMSVLPGLFKQVKRRVPEARLQWAYGWGLFELLAGHHAEALAWMKNTQREMDEAGIESLGHLSQAEVGKLYRRGAILAYPTDYPEIDPISVRKAQACGCVPVTTDSGGLADGVRFGIKIPCKGTSKRPGRFHFGIEDAATQRLWVDATVDLLTHPAKREDLAARGADWARQFTWPAIAERWDSILRS
jgi:glycosyltransferase involved in cell wall biosynthesis